MTEDTSPASVAERVRVALDSQDLELMRPLLAPDAKWGGPDTDPKYGCQNRDQVLRWWSDSRGRGMSGRVIEVIPGPDALLVGVAVTGTEEADEAGGTANRWQVMKLRDGLVTDIRGFEDRAEAARRAGVVDPL